MKKGLTEYVFVLDCSQSISAYKTKAIETFNSMLKDFKSREDDMRFLQEQEEARRARKAKRAS